MALAHTCPECGIPWTRAGLWRISWTAVGRWTCKERPGGVYPVLRRKPRRNKRLRSDCTWLDLHNTHAHGRPTLIKINKHNNIRTLGIYIFIKLNNIYSCIVYRCYKSYYYIVFYKRTIRRHLYERRFLRGLHDRTYHIWRVVSVLRNVPSTAARLEDLCSVVQIWLALLYSVVHYKIHKIETIAHKFVILYVCKAEVTYLIISGCGVRS